MTLRARPVARRRGRAGWDSGDRRNSLINLGFFLAIGVSVIILVGYTAWSWYDDHFGAAATVDGKVITKDELISRIRIESFRLDYIESRINTLVAKGQIDPADGQQQIQFLGQRRQQLANLTLERLVDNALMARLADENGIVVTEADVDGQLHDEATTSEQRHVWMIEVEPVADPITGDVSDEEQRAALGRAQSALGRLTSGESWDDVARTASDSALASQSGDLGWLAENSGYDEAFMAAVFAAASNVPTEIVEGDDGIYRIGRHTEIAPEEFDPTLESRIEQDGILFVDYRVAARGDVIRKKLSEKIVADLSKPSKQRHVLEIYLPEPNESSIQGETGAKVRWIVFSPNDDIAKVGDVPADDAAWTKAKADADAAYAVLRGDISKFDAMARSDSDEHSARITGGKQPWIYPSTAIDEAIRDVVLETTRTPDELLAPVRGKLGWYLIQFLRPTGAGETAYLEALKANVGDDTAFGRVAKTVSEGAESKDSGDLGWIAMGQLADELDTAVFATTVGSLSSVIPIPGDGTYLLRVIGEETRDATEEQLQIFEDGGFSYWYTRQKGAADIVYNLGSTSGTA